MSYSTHISSPDRHSRAQKINWLFSLFCVAESLNFFFPTRFSLMNKKLFKSFSHISSASAKSENLASKKKILCTDSSWSAFPFSERDKPAAAKVEKYKFSFYFHRSFCSSHHRRILHKKKIPFHLSFVNWLLRYFLFCYVHSKICTLVRWS